MYPLFNYGEDAQSVARDAIDEDVPRPVRRRYFVNDSSMEKLGEILNQNPNGVTCYRDELIGLLKSLDKPGQEGARSFYLEAWNGTGRYTYDRIGRGTIDIDNAIISVIGSIQPGPLAAYLKGATANGAGADGLIQRFQLAVWPDLSTEWRNVDRWPDSRARQVAYETYARLDQLDAASVGATTDEFDPDGIPFLRFDAQAQGAFDAWRSALEHQLRRGDEHPAMVSHLAKYRSLIPSIALLIHLAEGNTGPVAVGAITKAIGWGRYLESHARRIFGAAITADIAAARMLARRVRDGDLPDQFALRDVYHRGWTGLATRDDIAAAVEVLSDLNWLFTTTESTTGRPRMRCWVNPKIGFQARNATAKTTKTVKSLPGPPLLEVLEVGSSPKQEESNPGEAGSAQAAQDLTAGEMHEAEDGCPLGEEPPDPIRFAGADMPVPNWEGV